MADLQWNRNFAFEQSGEDEELLAELLALLQESSGSDLAKIASAEAIGDVVTMGEAAHSIKGAAASLGVEGMRDVAYKLEKAMRNDDLQKACSYIAPLKELVDQLGTLH